MNKKYLAGLILFFSVITYAAATNLYTDVALGWRNAAHTEIYLKPAGAGTLARTIDNVSTATALAADPSDCAADTYATTIAASGNLTCATVTNAGLAGSIADTKLSTIATALKVSNSATTATSANTNSAIVARDGSGNFTATTITAALTGTASGNTTLASPVNHGVLVSGSAKAMTATAAGTSGQPLLSGGASADPAYGTLSVGAGGTGQTSLTAHGVLIGNSTSAINFTGAGSAGQVLVSNGASADPGFTTATYPTTIAISRIPYASGTDTISSISTFLFNGTKLMVNTTNTDGTVSSGYNGASANGFCANDTSSTNGSTHVLFETGGSIRGSITNNNNTGVLYNVSSDRRLKTNITPMIDGLTKVIALKPVNFMWKSNSSIGSGLIADEMQAVTPDCVTGKPNAVDKDGKPVYQQIDKSCLVPYLVQAIQKLESRIADLEKNKK